jgi:hypothetical protein
MSRMGEHVGVGLSCTIDAGTSEQNSLDVIGLVPLARVLHGRYKETTVPHIQK